MKKVTVLTVACLLFLAGATAQEKPHPAKSGVDAPVLEAKVRKVWENFKNKNKEALAAMLSEEFREVEEGATGFGDKKAEIAAVDDFELKTYTLKDFTVKSLGPHSVLVTYLAHYEGKSGNEAVNANSAFGEIWILEGTEWKGLYAQETALK